MDGELKTETGEGAGGAKAEVDLTKVSLREAIQHSYKEIEKKSAEAEGAARQKADKQAKSGTSEQQVDEQKSATAKPAVDKSADPVDNAPAKTTEAPGATTPVSEPSATTALPAPSSWSKEKHPVWEGMTPEAKAYVLERERQSQDGVQQLKRSYEDLDAALAPHKELMKRAGQTAGQTVRQLLDWNTALAGPHKELAFAQLAQRFGVDVSKLAPQGQPQVATQGQQAGIPDQFRPVYDDLRTRQEKLEAELRDERAATRDREVRKAAADIQVWAKDKPHFEKVRGTMQTLVGADLQAQANGHPLPFGIVGADGSVDLDRAYSRAIVLDDELSATVRAEDQAKRDAAIRAEAEAKAKAEADKAAHKAAKDKEDAERARKAGTSLRPGSATGPGGKPGASVPKGEAVRDTIRRSLREVRG